MNGIPIEEQIKTSITNANGPVIFSAIGHEEPDIGPHVDILARGFTIDGNLLQVAVMHMTEETAADFLNHLEEAIHNAFHS